MEIYFLRHASAGEKFADPEKDEKRPLDEKGIRQCIAVGRLLATMKFKVGSIVSSPLVRASQTATLVAKEIGFKKQVEHHDALRPESTYDEFKQLIGSRDRKASIMVVGHNPNESEFLSMLISDRAMDDGIDLKKAAIAKVNLEDGQASLEWLITPKVVEAVQPTPATSSRPKTSRK